MGRRSFAPPYMKRLQRSFPQPAVEEAPPKVSLEAAMLEWEETSGTPAKPVVAPPVEELPVVAPPPVEEAASIVEDDSEETPEGDEALASLLRLSRKRLLRMAEVKQLLLPVRATKRQIAELLLEHEG